MWLPEDPQNPYIHPFSSDLSPLLKKRNRCTKRRGCGQRSQDGLGGLVTPIEGIQAETHHRDRLAGSEGIN